MKITSITKQTKKAGWYSVFVDNEFAFSLSEAGLLERRLVEGQELNDAELERFKGLSKEDKHLAAALRYVALRLRSQWEVEQYLKRRRQVSSPTAVEEIVNKLSKLGLIDDNKYASVYINDRRLLRPTSRRKIIQELRLKHVPVEAVEQALAELDDNDSTALAQIIERKRRQSPKYQDDLKLMQYLARQGFNYGDIKSAMAKK